MTMQEAEDVEEDGECPMCGEEATVAMRPMEEYATTLNLAGEARPCVLDGWMYFHQREIPAERVTGWELYGDAVEDGGAIFVGPEDGKGEE